MVFRDSGFAVVRTPLLPLEAAFALFGAAAPEGARGGEAEVAPPTAVGERLRAQRLSN
jgi:hypothetical protein